MGVSQWLDGLLVYFNLLSSTLTWTLKIEKMDARTMLVVFLLFQVLEASMLVRHMSQAH